MRRDAFRDKGLSFSLCVCAWAEREARICHMLRSGCGNVKEVEPDQKRGFCCLFLSQISAFGEYVRQSVLQNRSTGDYAAAN